MNNFVFPIIGRVDSEKLDNFMLILKYIGPGDRIIGFLLSPGGDINIMSTIAGTLRKLPTEIERLVYAGKNVSSATLVIFCFFEKRIAFEDSTFLIHESIPPVGMIRDEQFEKFDQQLFEAMSQRMKISLESLLILAKEEREINAQEALEIGLVDEIIPRLSPKSLEEFEKSVLTAQF